MTSEEVEGKGIGIGVQVFISTLINNSLFILFMDCVQLVPINERPITNQQLVNLGLRYFFWDNF